MWYLTRESGLNVNLFIQSETCLKITVCPVLVHSFDDCKERKSGSHFIPRVHWKAVFFFAWILGVTLILYFRLLHAGNIETKLISETVKRYWGNMHIVLQFCLPYLHHYVVLSTYLYFYYDLKVKNLWTDDWCSNRPHDTLLARAITISNCCQFYL